MTTWNRFDESVSDKLGRKIARWQHFSSNGHCHAQWLPFFTIKGCLGARKQDMKIFLSFLNQAKTGQLDQQ
jgi:hypothetical protein